MTVLCFTKCSGYQLIRALVLSNIFHLPVYSGRSIETVKMATTTSTVDEAQPTTAENEGYLGGCVQRNPLFSRPKLKGRAAMR